MRCCAVVTTALFFAFLTPSQASELAFPEPVPNKDAILFLVLNSDAMDHAANRLHQRLAESRADEIVVEETRFSVNLFAPQKENVPSPTFGEDTAKRRAKFARTDASSMIRILPQVVLGARTGTLCTPTIKGRITTISKSRETGDPTFTSQLVEVRGTDSIEALGSALGGIECLFADVNVVIQAELGVSQRLGNPLHPENDGFSAFIFKNPSKAIANFGLGFLF